MGELKLGPPKSEAFKLGQRRWAPMGAAARAMALD